MGDGVRVFRFELAGGDFVDFVVGVDERGFWVRPVLRGVLWERCGDCSLDAVEVWGLLCGLFLGDGVEVVDVFEVGLSDLGSGVSGLSEFVGE